ncbi:MAG: histidine phosphatase family protein [Ignavibacteriales bacterium]|nr:histidine phosphatase family protein [Ignavibacteriales bacterium]MCB9258697.1 histidine phosphatase family protein [Ignavibacteriales bacterium]
MKTLYLIRHAKSSWDFPNLSDFERPLNERGQRDAPFMGKLLSERIKSPQIIYSSPAKRAITTAEIIAEFLGYDVNSIIKNENIYEAAVSDLMRIINNNSDEYSSLMLFGHNPGFTLISNYLADKKITNLPTCGFVQIDFNLNSWNNIEGSSGNLMHFEYPKKYINEEKD